MFQLLISRNGNKSSPFKGWMSERCSHECLPKRLPTPSIFSFALHPLLLEFFPRDALSAEIGRHLPVSGISDRDTRFLVRIDGLYGIVLLNLGKNRFYFGLNDHQIGLQWN